MDDDVAAIFDRQDQLIARRQALRCLTQDEIGSRLGRRWGVVLPGVYSSSPAAPTPRQRIRAALLHAGPGAMLTDLSALVFHRIPDVPDDWLVRVLVSAEVQRLSRDFVVIRRTTRMPKPVIAGGVPIAPVARALAEFIARHQHERESLAVASAVVQRNIATLDDLIDEVRKGPARGRPRAMRVLEPVQAGVRSAPEEDFRQLVRRSRVLPLPLWNPTLRLPGGQVVSPDALFTDAGLVHETNGRRYHFGDSDGELFGETQRRHDALVAAGLTVLHNSPTRILAEGRQVLGEVEQCFRRTAGSGLPPGVVLVRPGPVQLRRAV